MSGAIETEVTQQNRVRLETTSCRQCAVSDAITPTELAEAQYSKWAVFIFVGEEPSRGVLPGAQHDGRVLALDAWRGPAEDPSPRNCLVRG